MHSTNPTYRPQPLPPFERIHPDHIVPAAEALLAEARAHLKALCTTTSAPTYDNTIAALDTWDNAVDWLAGVVAHLEGVDSTPQRRAAFNEILPRLSDLSTELYLNRKLWRRIQIAAQTPPAQPIKARFTDKVQRAFQRQGAELAGKRRQQLQRINRALSIETNRFTQHVLDATASWSWTTQNPKHLTGLPNSQIAAAAQRAAEQGESGWRFDLDEPTLINVLTYAEHRPLRKRLWRAYSRRAAARPRDNRTRIRRILSLRRRKAQLLGYPDFPTYILEERMAQTPGRVREFLAELEAAARRKTPEEDAELQAFAQSEGFRDTELAPWDLRFYAERLRRSRYEIDEEQVRQYFPLDRVLTGLVEWARQVFGVVVQEVHAKDREFPQVWHQDVRFFRVYDRVSRQPIGAFYADLHPRPSKRGGAWMQDFWTGIPNTNDDRQLNVGLLAANITRPQGDRPATLRHSEVETIFHEFGHLLHHICNRVPIQSLAGTHVAWDFVELPSQLMENWCWQRASLPLISAHVDSGTPLPEALLEKLLAARNFRSANAMLRQLSFGNLDLDLHLDFDPETMGARDVIPFARQRQQRYTPAQLPRDYAMVCSFSHLFAGPVAYASGYYSYKWAEVLEADAFTRFEQAGVLNPDVGTEFRDTILAAGDSQPPETLYRRFRGRDADTHALLVRCGLAAKKE